MIHTPETLNRKAAQVLQLLHEATTALTAPEVLEAVTLVALAHPEIEWEPVALAACALNAKRERDKASGKTAEPLAVTVNLPQTPGPSAGGGVGGVSLPHPPWGFM